jgi:Predicted membrane-associated Zn-dependent proteases 1
MTAPSQGVGVDDASAIRYTTLYAVRLSDGVAAAAFYWRRSAVFESLPDGLVTIAAFLLMLGLLVLVHELGHFLTAVWFGIKVEEFGLGYPPRAMVLFERNGVTYTLNWLPIGGFVRFGGEGDQIYGVGSLSTASPWKKIAVLFAGPLMNLLLAFLIFSGIFMARGVPEVFDGARIDVVYPATPAERAGLRSGDLLVALNGRMLATDLSVIRLIAAENRGRAIEAVVERDGVRTVLMITPGRWERDGVVHENGFGFAYTPHIRIVSATPLRALSTGFTHTFDILERFVVGIGQMLGSLLGINEAPPGGVAGVVGIARGTGEVIQRDGWIGFWHWTALISLNLFLINLLPIPALDGSHILFALIEIARGGKKIPPEREAMVHAIGFMMLMGLMVVITVSDVANWIGGNPVLGGG